MGGLFFFWGQGAQGGGRSALKLGIADSAEMADTGVTQQELQPTPFPSGLRVDPSAKSTYEPTSLLGIIPGGQFALST